MQQELKKILEIQELDMNMLQLLNRKRERRKELDKIDGIKADLEKRMGQKQDEITEQKTLIRHIEGEVKETVEKIKKYEDQQSLVKKVDEFNALSHEISREERERVNKEQQLSKLYDILAEDEETLKNLSETLDSTVESSQTLEEEIKSAISEINTEGQKVKKTRDTLSQEAHAETFAIYERLLKNKRNRVIVPIENRTCSGCHITLTPQHENLVRKGDRLTFCEHCSRIHFWPESEVLEGTAVSPKPRRRRRTN
ncbi:MAG: C4-type zinc ribbon domain-containing protein [Waddliaceae bacterium]